MPPMYRPLNNCYFCRTSHRAAAAHYPNCSYDLVDAVCRDRASAPISSKLKALSNIAGLVQISGKLVSAEDVAAAKAVGASDFEIHDTVLIAAAFCMYNRYLEGLAMHGPSDEAVYDQMGALMARAGYLNNASEAVAAGVC